MIGRTVVAGTTTVRTLTAAVWGTPSSLVSFLKGYL